MSTSLQSIDTAMARRMVDASAIHGVSIIGQSGCWSVMLRLGRAQRPLSAQRSNELRTWRSLDRCVEFLKRELHISEFEYVDAREFNFGDGAKKRVDASERMKAAHAAVDYDKWFRAQVQESLDDPNPSIPHAIVEAEFAKRRKALLAKIAA